MTSLRNVIYLLSSPASCHPPLMSRSVALFHALGPDAAETAGPKLVHYGKYSYLAFDSGENRAKGVARVEGGPLVHRFPAAETGD